MLEGRDPMEAANQGCKPPYRASASNSLQGNFNSIPQTAKPLGVQTYAKRIPGLPLK
ncbi:MAG: hypothetical protein IPP17_29620 [Bacteroidetes bacterium]|nr:hypothetical protein [Bacteroidota bacterium]